MGGSGRRPPWRTRRSAARVLGCRTFAYAAASRLLGKPYEATGSQMATRERCHAQAPEHRQELLGARSLCVVGGGSGAGCIPRRRARNEAAAAAPPPPAAAQQHTKNNMWNDEKRTQARDVLILFSTRPPEVPTLSPGPVFRPESCFDCPGGRLSRKTSVVTFHDVRDPGTW